MAGRNVPQYLELLFREDSLVSSTSSLRGCEKKLITTTTSCPKKIMIVDFEKTWPWLIL